MGIVYLAVAQGPAGFAKLKVIKRLRPDFASDKRALQMFLDEARTSARLLHPNIVQTNEVGFDGKHYFLEMEYLEGQSYEALTRKAAESGGLPLSLALWILTQTLGGLHYAHESTDLEGKPLKVVHRDVSPHNVFVTYDGNVKVLDFGIAKAADSSSETQTGAVKGKATYMAPEQSTRKGVDHRADIFAVGVMLWQAITGTRLWGDLTDFEIFMRLQTQAIPSPRTVQPDVPGDLETICMRALAIDPNDRFASAADFQTALEEHLEATGVRKGFRSSQRELAKTMTELFSVQRAAAKAEIEAEMKKEATAARTGVDLPRLGETAGEPVPENTKSVGSTTTESMRVRDGNASLRRTALLAVGAALIASAAVAVVSNRTKSRSAAPLPSASAAATIVKECNTNAECMHLHANAPWICRKDDWKCAALESADCKVMAEPGDVENDRTIWIGAMFPTTGPQAAAGGINALHAVDLVRRDFVQMTHGIPPISGDAAPRPLAVLACDDSKDSLRIAHHLVDDVGVPAVIGFASSQEVIDLATSIFIPKRVLMLASMNSSALITAIPHPIGVPRLVWRTTLSTADVAAPVSVVVSDFFEPRIRAARAATAEAPIRLALLRRGNTVGQSLAGSLFDRVRFNGKNTLENGENFHEFVVKDSPTDTGLRLSTKALVDFRPHIILCDPDELTERVLALLQSAWPAAESFKPYTLFPEGFPAGKGLSKFLAASKEQRGRFLGLGTPSTTTANAQLTMRFNEIFTEKVTLDSSPADSYDGMYLLAYAAYVAGEKLSGLDLARAMARLVPPGKSVDVGPLRIFEAVGALRNGENIDLSGAMTPLDFDLSTGETSSSYVIECCSVKQDGSALEQVESGLRYDATTKKLTGTLQCP
jgi:hypothetical protein